MSLTLYAKVCSVHLLFGHHEPSSSVMKWKSKLAYLRTANLSIYTSVCTSLEKRYSNNGKMSSPGSVLHLPS